MEFGIGLEQTQRRIDNFKLLTGRKYGLVIYTSYGIKFLIESNGLC